MLKKGLFIVTLTLLILTSYHHSPAYAGWSHIHGEEATNYNLWAIWGSSANDVYAVGTGGAILHYDGNSGDNWELLPSISP